MPTSMAKEPSFKLKSSSAELDWLSGPSTSVNELVGSSQPGSAPTPVPSLPSGVKLLESVESSTCAEICPWVLPQTRLFKSLIPAGCGVVELSLLTPNLPPVVPEAVPLLLMMLLASVIIWLRATSMPFH